MLFKKHLVFKELKPSLEAQAIPQSWTTPSMHIAKIT
jgi:hypothetical protein